MQAFAVVGMASNLALPAMRLVHDRFELCDRQGWLRNQVAVLIHPRAVRHVHLDPVRAVIELLARRFSRFDRTINDLHSLRYVNSRA